MESERLAGDRRCWPCTVANLAVGLVIAWVPLVAVLSVGTSDPVPAAVAWGVAVTVFTVYRIVGHGFLPPAGRVAKATGLHERIGAGGPRGGTNDPDAGDPPQPGDDQVGSDRG